jgi:hypothetical protein
MLQTNFASDDIQVSVGNQCPSLVRDWLMLMAIGDDCTQQY